MHKEKSVKYQLVFPTPANSLVLEHVEIRVKESEGQTCTENNP